MAGDVFTPRPMGAALDSAVHLYRRNFKAIALSAASTVFPVALVMGLAQDFYYRGTFEVAFSSSGTTGPVGMPIGLFAAYSVILAASGLLWFARAYLDTAVLASAPAMAAGGAPRYRETLGGGRHRWGWYLLAQLLVSTISGTVTFLTIFVLGLGGLVAGVFMAFTGVVTVVEQVDPVKALARSFELVRGSFWRVTGYLVLMFALATALQGAIASPVAIGQLVPALSSADPVTALLDVPVWWRVVEGLSFGAAAALAAPFTSLALFYLYLDLRSRKEGMDLIMRAREIAAGR